MTTLKKISLIIFLIFPLFNLKINAQSGFIFDENSFQIIVKKMVGNSEWPEKNSIKINFYKIDTDKIFAGISGDTSSGMYDYTAFVSSGLIKIIENENEVAAILSHEMAHIREFLDFRKDSKTLFAPTRILSRPEQFFEYESSMDLSGIVLMEKSGYDPKAMISIFQKTSVILEKENPIMGIYMICRIEKVKRYLKMPNNLNTCIKALER